MKKIIITLLALVMVASVGCQNNKKPTDMSAVAETVTIQSNSTQSEPTTTAATENTTKKNNTTAIKNTESTDVTQETTKATESTTQPTTKKVTAKPTTISTKYYSITFPASWYDQYAYEIIDKKHTYINHKDSVNAGFTGTLFSIELFDSSEDYTVYPIHTYINTIQTKGGQVYDVVAVYPSDAQCSERFLTDYNRLSYQSPSMLKNIKYPSDIKVVQ